MKPRQRNATRGDVASLGGKIRSRFNKIDRRFDEVDRRFVQVDQRFAQVDQRFAQVDQRFDQVDQRFDEVDRRFAQVGRRFDENDRKIDRVAAALTARLDRIEPVVEKVDLVLAGQERMMARMDAFAGKWIQLERSYFTLHDRVGAHERRITALEQRSGRGGA